jgi:hypothetical protein
MNQRKPFSSGCLICGSDDVKSRGLCDVHYRRFNAKQKKIASEQGEAASEKFEADCLADGWILPKTKGGRPKDADPFDVIAAKIVAECKSTYGKRKNDGTPSA